MTDRPIIFSAPMIHALLAGTKKQTRRVGKMRRGVMMDDLEWDGPPGTIRTGRARKDHIAVPYAIGDRLWVREAWQQWPPENRRGMVERARIYRATDIEPTEIPAWITHWKGKFLWQSPIHMPRYASRLTLSVQAVRVQRLQDISSADAIAEGICPTANLMTIDCDTHDPRLDFKHLWNGINMAREGCSWADNPWVVAVSFAVEHGNIDRVAA